MFVHCPSVVCRCCVFVRATFRANIFLIYHLTLLKWPAMETSTFAFVWTPVKNPKANQRHIWIWIKRAIASFLKASTRSQPCSMTGSVTGVIVADRVKVCMIANQVSSLARWFELAWLLTLAMGPSRLHSLAGQFVTFVVPGAGKCLCSANSTDQCRGWCLGQGAPSLREQHHSLRYISPW